MKKQNIIVLIIILATISCLLTTYSVIRLEEKKKQDNEENKINIKTKEEINYKENTICKAVDSNSEIGQGKKYTCKVNGSEEYIFYVLSIIDDKVNLILDRNICEDGSLVNENNECSYAWHEKELSNKKGPDTAMKIVYDATKKWTNIPDMIMNYEDENNNGNEEHGYRKIETNNSTKETKIIMKNGNISLTIGSTDKPLKARLPEQREMEYNGCKLYSGATCPPWLIENLRYWEVPNDKYSFNKSLNLNKTNGYWLLSSSDKGSDNALHIHSSGYIIGYNSNNLNYGIRPVITIYKSNLYN